MTVFVTRPKKVGTGFIKPERVNPHYSWGDMLHWLVAKHEDAIYFTDDTTEWDEAPVTETHVEFQIFASDVAVSPVFKTRDIAETMLGVRDFKPGEAEVRSRTVTTTTSLWKTEESK